MERSEIVVGVRVKCVFRASPRCGQFGTISRVSAPVYWIKWDDAGSPDGGWRYPSSMELVDPEVLAKQEDQRKRLEHAMKYL